MIKKEKKGIQVPYSTGRNYPLLTIPKNACDSHHHIFNPVEFPYLDTDVRNQPPATVDAYRMLQKKLGLTRNVIVTSSAYGTDNGCTLDALQKMGENARAVVVIDNSISDEELRRMNEMGVRGIRFNITRGGSDDVDMIGKLAERIAGYGWHICFWMSADMTVSLAGFLNSLPCPVVFDHRGHLPAEEGVRHKAFGVITDMMKQGKAYVKLSALYHDSRHADYHDTIAVGKAYVEASPEQVLWGTDWPHPSEYTAKKDMPNDASLLDAVLFQAGSNENVEKILVTNPERLFGFKKTR